MFPRPRPAPTPSNLKKRAAAQDDSPSSQEGEPMELEEIDFSSNLPEEQVSVEFEFYDPDDSHFLSLKSLLNGYLDGLSFGSSELCDLVIDQVEVGTMIGVAEDDESNENPQKKEAAQKKEKEAVQKRENSKKAQKQRDVLGFATVIEMSKLGKSKVGGEILSFIQEKSAKFNDKHSKLEEILGGKYKVGLLLNERIVNLSPQLIPILHGQVLEDIKWAEEEGRGEYKFDFIICLTKIFKDHKVAGKKKQKTNENLLNEFIFQKFEDFVFAEKAEIYFMFQAHTSKNSAGITNLEAEMGGEVCYRLVWVVKGSDFEAKVGRLGEFIEK